MSDLILDTSPVHLLGPPGTVLVLCTGNSARSILAEAIFNQRGGGKLIAYSAGSQPKDEPHPAALALLRNRGINTSFARSKSWDEFAGPDAPEIDLVVTVCDSAASEACPVWPGQPLAVHWGIPDPAAATGNAADIAAAFDLAYRRLDARIAAFLDLPFESLTLQGLKDAARDIGRMHGATGKASIS
jgi:protein-tyrosine-phosphatase